ncbi:MAG: glycoside hydrolase family 26 protein, partial [Thermomicrobiales bacterium]
MRRTIAKHIHIIVGILLLTPIAFLLNPGLSEAVIRSATAGPVGPQPAAAEESALREAISSPDRGVTTSGSPRPIAKVRPGPATTPGVGASPTSAPVTVATPTAPTAAAPAPPGVALGAYISSAPWDPTKIDEFSRLVGAPPAVVMWYQNWAGADKDKVNFAPGAMDAVARRGAMPMVTWEPWDDSGEIAQPAFALRTILAGEYDPYIRHWARDAAAWHKPFYLRFAPEMNGDWYPWAPRVSGNTAAEYVATWRHVHDIFREEGATNVRWVWSPNVADAYTTPFAEVYPGDNYVDWIALVGYNWGTSQSWSGWLSFADY